MLLGIPRSARCVQRFDDSLNSAIHITYRISLRSSSMREPRDPLLKVVFVCIKQKRSMTVVWCKKRKQRSPSLSNLDQYLPQRCTGVYWIGKGVHMPRKASYNPVQFINDPSAGSPTETLLRLLLPLNDQV